MQKRLGHWLAVAGLLLDAGCAGVPAQASPDRVASERPGGRHAVTDEPAGAELEALARRIAGEHLSVAVEELEVAEIAAIEWRDSSLGCPQPGWNYLQVITPGHYAIVRHGGKTWRVHMANGRGFVCEPESKPSEKRPLIDLTFSQAQLEELARADLARRLGVGVEEIAVRETRAVNWRDAGLGCTISETAASGASNGYLMMLVHGEQAYEYRSDLRRVMPCPPAGTP